MEVSPWVDDWVEEIVLVLGRKRGESQANQGAQKCENQHLKPNISDACVLYATICYNVQFKDLWGIQQQPTCCKE